MHKINYNLPVDKCKFSYKYTILIFLFYHIDLLLKTLEVFLNYETFAC